MSDETIKTIRAYNKSFKGRHSKDHYFISKGEIDRGTQVFESFLEAQESLMNQGFKKKEQSNIREDKWYLFRKGKQSKIVTPKYDSILGTSWHIRSF